jgi:hypothetical protein
MVMIKQSMYQKQVENKKKVVSALNEMIDDIVIREIFDGHGDFFWFCFECFPEFFH